MNSLTRLFTILFCVLMGGWSVTAVGQTLMWAKNLGGTAADFGRSLSLDAAGNVYTTGDFRGKADFDPGPGEQFLEANGTNNDIFVSKLDPNGNYLWAKSAGGTNPDIPYGIAAAPNGDVYIVGAFQGTGVDFDPGTGTRLLSSDGGNDIFIWKLRANGELAWAHRIGSTGADMARAVVLDAAENVYVSGSFTGVVDFDPGAGVVNMGTGTTASGFVLKLNSDGIFQWAANTGAAGVGMKLDSKGNILLTGAFAGTVDFDPGAATNTLSTTGGNDVFVLKLNPKGEYVWAVKMGGTGADAGTAIAVDQSDNVLTVGTFSGTADFDPGPLTENLASSGGTDVFISKLDANGNYLWVKRIGGTGADLVSSLAVDSDGRIYFGGRYEGTVDFDPGPGVKIFTSLACCGGTWIMPDAYMIKLDHNGDFQWGFSMGSEDGTENVYSINLDKDNNLYTTGNFTGYANFAPAPDTVMVYTLGTSDDAFVAKYAQPSCKTYATQNISTGCASVTINGQTYNKNGTYEQLFTNKAGCDSVLTLHIALNNIVPTTINQVACNSFTFNGKTYTNSTTFRDTFKNVNNCDSVVVHNLTINRSATTLLTQSACGSYTYNGVTYVTGGTYTHNFQTSKNCDSTVILYLTINQPSTPTTTTVEACGSYVFGGTTYVNSGTYSHVFKNTGGCDSTATINLTINQSSTSQLTVSACESYTYDGKTYNSNGTYTHYFTNAKGCDSVVVLLLTINQPVRKAVSAVACDEYTLNGQTYNTSGTYSQTFTAANGCDSIVELSLVINESPEATITVVDELFVAGGGTTYQWLDCNNNYAPIPSANTQTLITNGAGRYAVEVTYRGCKDTSECMESFPASVAALESDEISLYPNPTTDRLVIGYSTGFVNATVRILNMSGQEVLKLDDRKGEQIIVDLAGLANGMYLVEVADGDKIHRSRVMKH